MHLFLLYLQHRELRCNHSLIFDNFLWGKGFSATLPEQHTTQNLSLSHTHTSIQLPLWLVGDSFQASLKPRFPSLLPHFLTHVTFLPLHDFVTYPSPPSACLPHVLLGFSPASLCGQGENICIHGSTIIMPFCIQHIYHTCTRTACSNISRNGLAELSTPQQEEYV